jgi:hypothetical protein
LETTFTRFGKVILQGDIFFKKSTDGGATFGDTINISNNAGLSENPQIASSGNNVYVVWKDNTTGMVTYFSKRVLMVELHLEIQSI